MMVLSILLGRKELKLRERDLPHGTQMLLRDVRHIISFQLLSLFIPFPRKNIYLFIYVFMSGCAGSSLLLGLPLVAKSESCSLVMARVLLIVKAPSVRRSASGGRGLQEPRFLGSRARLNCGSPWA